jgi:hypothetical protein
MENKNNEQNEIIDYNHEITNKNKLVEKELENFESKIEKYFENNEINLVILTPCYGGVCNVDFTICLIDTMFLLQKYKIKATFETCRNDSLVSRARNNLMAKAMLKNPTHIFFIDSDIVWKAIDVLKLLMSDKELIGGIYPKKKYNWKIFEDKNILNKYDENLKKSVFKNMFSSEDFPTCKLIDYNFATESAQVNVIENLIELKHLPTGFMMIKKCVVEDLMKEYKNTKYVDDVGFLQKNENEFAYALFDCGVENNQYMSEDWVFCNRYKKTGGKIYADITIDLIHIGTTYYKGKTASIFV